ncbi:MAG: acyl-CoA dehydratase activase-related protein, partial [Smithellaceae bacterium]|nr:acyl-CoA dehydratase activase-related protein [Smithellaceae bacterium]
EIKRRLESGLLAEGNYSLGDLRDREIGYDKSFICQGGKEKCDRKCEINRIRIEGKIYPFGGACNRWYNERFNIHVEADRLNLVRRHEELSFGLSASPPAQTSAGREKKTIGLNKSFFINSYYPLFLRFFEELGFRVILSAQAVPAGIDLKRSAFCYPAELAHGFFLDLLAKKPDYIMIPHIKGTYVERGAKDNTTCPISQGEPYYLASAFGDHPFLRGHIESGRYLQPVLELSRGRGVAEAGFLELGRKLGAGAGTVRAAFRKAWEAAEQLRKERERIGREFLTRLEGEPGRYAVVIFGRSYNAFVPEANMGIPQKIASRGIETIPFDFLPLAGEEAPESMYWASGQQILKGAALVARHPQLFPCYISNFSCGPDSFLGGYFRERMGRKPFLLLELDSHVADAGLETRIEAFLDIIRNYRRLAEARSLPPRCTQRKNAYYDQQKMRVIDFEGQSYPLEHPRVHMIIPSMGAGTNEAAAAVFRGLGIRTSALPPADEGVLKLGRGNSSCKECLPLQLTLGSLINYLNNRTEKEELLVYFMPTAAGPCRFGQYSTFISSYVERMGIEDVVLFSLPAETSYDGGFGDKVILRLWAGLLLAQMTQDLHSHFLVNALDPPNAKATLDKQWQRLLKILEGSPGYYEIKRGLREVKEELVRVPVRRSLEESPAVLLTGEIFVRHDGLARQYLVEKLAAAGFVTKVASIGEWIYYTDWLIQKGINSRLPGLKARARLFLRNLVMKSYERGLKGVMEQNGPLPRQREDVDRVMRNARHLINPQLSGEAILTIGSAFTEVPRHYSGVIAIGPFGCMPNQISEAILSREMGQGWQEAPWAKKGMERFSCQEELPFLAIESDGNPFPQIINARLEVFMMQARRLHAMRTNSHE